MPATSRRTVLLRGGAALAALAAGPVAGIDPALAAGDDAPLLTTLALLEDTAVYVYANVAPRLDRAPLPGFLQPFLVHHRQHRDLLLRQLHGLGAPVPAAGQAHPDALPTAAGEAAAVAALLAVERRLLAAQYSALAALAAQPLRVQVASIFGVDARHATVWRAASGQDPVPASFVTGS
jgi:Domain of unknown function (DUF4439)